jgi:hypothetical protein
MAAVTAGVSHAMDLALSGPGPVRTAGPATADRSPAAARPGRTIRSWPLLVLAAPAAAEVWSGWVGIAQKTGFGLVSPLPGIWPSLHLDTAITLPVGVEAYAAYALRAWLARDHSISGRTRRFAKWSAICSFALGMAGQVAHHLMAQARRARAPWAITTVVSCRRSWSQAWGPCWRTCSGPMPRPPVRRTVQRVADDRMLTGTGPRGRTGAVPRQDNDTAMGSPELAQGPPNRRWIRPV